MGDMSKALITLAITVVAVLIALWINRQLTKA